MAMNTRERYVAIAAAAAFGLFALDHFALTPYLHERERLQNEETRATLKLAEDARLRQKQRVARGDWEKLQAAGLQSDPSEMERQMQHWLHLWAQEAGLTNLSLRADRAAAQQSGFVQVTVHAAGTGPVAAVTKLLWRLEGSPVAVKVNELQLTPAKEGSEQLQVQLNVSSLCSAPEAETSRNPGSRLVASPQPVTGERL